MRRNGTSVAAVRRRPRSSQYWFDSDVWSSLVRRCVVSHKCIAALVLLAVCVVARGAQAQSSDNQMLGVQIVADQWNTDSIHAWGKNVGLGLRERFGGSQHVRGYVAVDGTFLHANRAPLYFTLEGAAMYSPLRFENTPLLPYIGAGAGSVLDLGANQTGLAVGGYY